jgi:hypothetical protein
MERWEGRMAYTDNNGPDKEVPAAGGDGPNNPLTGGDLLLDLTGFWDDLPGGAKGGWFSS